MTAEQQAIKHIDECVKEYRQMEVLEGNRLNELLREISGTLHYLEGVRSEVHNEWQILVSKLVSDGNSVARAENQAHIEFPLMYLLRHKMNSSYEVIGAIRTNISYLKSERNATM